MCIYPLVIEHSHGKWPIEIDGLPIKTGDFPWLTVKYPDGISLYIHM